MFRLVNTARHNGVRQLRTSLISSLLRPVAVTVPVPVLPSTRVTAVASFTTQTPTAAEDANPFETSAVPAAPLNDANVEPLNARYPGGKSVTARVLEVLKTGPKTRKQIYYAINKGPPAVKEAAKPAAPAIAGRKPSPSKVKRDLDDDNHPYPTGLLRNPSHLRTILQSLQRGKRLWSRPQQSVQHLLTPSTKASVDEILKSNPYSQALLQSENAARHEDALSQPWVYVLRDWADPGFGAKGEHKQALRVAKLERQRLKRVELIEQANADGKKLLLGRPITLTRKQRMKAEKAQREAEYKTRVEEMTAAYRQAVLNPKTQGQPSTLDAERLDGHDQLLQPMIDAAIAKAESRSGPLSDFDKSEIEAGIRASAYQHMVNDSEAAARALLFTENPKMTPELAKKVIKQRSKFIAKMKPKTENQSAQ